MFAPSVSEAGVVVQQARLLPGSIFHNIIGSSTALTVDDAWEAARIAGLDEDIRAMPMGNADDDLRGQRNVLRRTAPADPDRPSGS